MLTFIWYIQNIFLMIYLYLQLPSKLLVRWELVKVNILHLYNYQLVWKKIQNTFWRINLHLLNIQFKKIHRIWNEYNNIFFFIFYCFILFWMVYYSSKYLYTVEKPGGRGWGGSDFWKNMCGGGFLIFWLFGLYCVLIIKFFENLTGGQCYTPPLPVFIYVHQSNC